MTSASPHPPLRFATGLGQTDTHAVTLSDGRPNGHPSAGTDYDTISGREIAALVDAPQAVPKASARWFIPSVYSACDARDHKVQRQHGDFWWLCVDIDKNNLPLAEVSATLETIAQGVSRLIYSTRSATATDQRWRALLPLAQALPGCDYTETAVAFYAVLQDASARMLIADPKLALTGQLVYLPNRGEFYEHEVSRGARLELTPEHRIIRRRDADRLAAETAHREAAERRARKRSERPQSGAGETPVDQFNSAHGIGELLERYGYARLGHTNNWRSPLQTSRTFATRDFGDHWVSLSGSDADAEIGAASVSGARFGDAFDLFVHFEHGGNFEVAVRAYGDECRDRTWAGFGSARCQNQARDTADDGYSADNNRTAADSETDEGTTSDSAGRDDGHTASGAGAETKTGGDSDPNRRLPTPFTWRDPALIPPRPWLYGRHLLRRQVSVTVAPGGLGKSSLSIVEALAMVVHRRLLGDWVAGELRVWLLNLEDPIDELERRIAAAMQHHGVVPEDLGQRLAASREQDR